MNRPNGPDDVDAAFARIVADLEREGVGTVPPPDDEPRQAKVDTADAPPAGEPPVGWRSHETEIDWSDENADEHYEPPEPPPLPKLRPPTIAAILLAILGVLLLIWPGMINLTARVGTPIGLTALACGLGLLLFRARKHPRVDPDNESGAQV